MTREEDRAIALLQLAGKWRGFALTETPCPFFGGLTAESNNQDIMEAAEKAAELFRATPAGACLLRLGARAYADGLREKARRQTAYDQDQ